MKIVIVGPGAMGLLFYGLLSKTKEDVWLLDKDNSRTQRLKKKLNITSDPQELSDARFWIVCVKSYDTKSVVKNILPHVAEDAFVLTFQNGLGNIELLSESFGLNRVLAGVTNMAATLISEGVTKHTGDGETIVGRIDSKLGVELRDLRDLFNKAKIPLKISKDISGVVWSKLVINAGVNALSALTRLSNGRLPCYEGSRDILREAVTEAVRVAKRKRVKLIYDDMLAKAESVCEATSENISSMLSDILNKKKTEIDFINGAVVRYGESLNVKTPVNAFLTSLIKTIELSYAYRVD